jgi:hypothetical protein
MLKSCSHVSLGASYFSPEGRQARRETNADQNIHVMQSFCYQTTNILLD